MYEFTYGMGEDGKIREEKSAGLSYVLTEKNYEYLKTLSPEVSGKYLWLPTEQLVALPTIKMVSDKDGRTWVHNHTLLIPIHEYLQKSEPFKLYGLADEPPETLEPIVIKEGE